MFRNAREEARREIGEKLNRLRIFRTRADYEDTLEKLGGTVGDLSAATEQTLRWAEEAIRAVAELSLGPD